MDYKVENIYPNPDCMCSREYPVFNKTKEPLENKQRFCHGLGVGSIFRNRAGLSDDKYFFSKDFINDGIVSGFIQRNNFPLMYMFAHKYTTSW